MSTCSVVLSMCPPPLMRPPHSSQQRPTFCRHAMSSSRAGRLFGYELAARASSNTSHRTTASAAYAGPDRRHKVQRARGQCAGTQPASSVSPSSLPRRLRQVLHAHDRERASPIHSLPALRTKLVHHRCVRSKLTGAAPSGRAAICRLRMLEASAVIPANIIKLHLSACVAMRKAGYRTGVRVSTPWKDENGTAQSCIPAAQKAQCVLPGVLVDVGLIL